MSEALARASETWDIIIAGGGNAALCAAIEAAERGAKVLILEGAPKPYRGGKSRHTRNFRCMHHGDLGPLVETYDEAEFFDDLIRVTKGETDEALARMCIRSSEDCLPWMQAHGVRFQPSLAGTLSLNVDLAGKTMRAGMAEGECLNADGARLSIPEQALSTSISGASICSGEGAPLVSARWTEAPHFKSHHR